ncbi:SRPBCC family protein [Microbacterium saperdae]|uniref:Polyketide cyclase/dehydrase/lipid transport protein n=1 Tax=Microbacterium saperdae TaxID=69368 RepID=A0A543BBE2_9MICO|nr:SRPBCC family protein [Microbacterium saperdae]TQL82171.1 polyketide cyclase/dehydrase/lipid transport protein [Microbacterium saperdae]GGM37733.1 cyclase [Microbacterium saperdae]
MVQIIETIDVDVPIGMAYDQWTRFESLPQFLDAVDSITPIDATHTRWTVSIGGAAQQFDVELTEQHPDEGLAWNSVGEAPTHAGVVAFHRLTEGSTRLTLQVDWEPAGFFEKIGVLTGAGARAVKKDLIHFKAFIESRSVGAGTGHGGADD